VWLLFLPVILGVLGLTAILAPIEAMLTSLLGVLPKLLAAAIIIIVGLFAARILQRIVTSALRAFGLDALSERVGLSRYLGKPNLPVGQLHRHIIVFIPVGAALNVRLTSAAPLSDMLNQVLLAIPRFYGCCRSSRVVVGRVIAT
jgi:hypothetical protein